MRREACLVGILIAVGLPMTASAQATPSFTDVGNTPVAVRGGDAVQFEDAAARLNNDIATALLADETISPILYPVDESCEDYDFEAWADSYVFGAGLGGDWYELAGKHADDLSELLEPMFLLNGMLKEDAEKNGERWFPPAEEARLVADIQDNLPVIVQTLYNFWRNKRTGGTVARSEDKVGRNDPCPCGSGKKFKQCCGSPEKLNSPAEPTFPESLVRAGRFGKSAP